MTRPAAPASAAMPVRDAATIILLRRVEGQPVILMGQRGAAAAFMPDKFVFPGGAVDPEDLAAAARLRDTPPLDARLLRDSGPLMARALTLAGLRELREETGLVLDPDHARLRYIFRAVTPPGRPRRFDARFFLAEADDILGHDDFARASGELLYLRWIDLAAARALSLPFITEVVLSELETLLEDPAAPRPVPFFNHTAEGSHFHLI